jgi:hypothetical protein
VRSQCKERISSNGMCTVALRLCCRSLLAVGLLGSLLPKLFGLLSPHLTIVTRLDRFTRACRVSLSAGQFSPTTPSLTRHILLAELFNTTGLPRSMAYVIAADLFLPC